MHAYGRGAQIGPAGNLRVSWERSVTPATLPLYSYGLLPPTGGVSLLLNL
nr:MAG TPA: Epidermal growth factor receptor [Caudoviricetes sp.]